MIFDSFKNRCLVLFFAFIPFSAYSQVCSGISAYNFNSGFYAGVQAGPNIFVADGFGAYKLNGSIGLSQNLFVGYDFSEILGARILVGNSSLNWPNPNPLPTLLGKQAFSSQQISVELLYNLSNYFNYYNLYRPLDFSIHAGAGLIVREKSNFDSEYTGFVVKGGLQIDYRLSFQFDLNLNGTLNIVPENFDGTLSGEPFNVIPEVKVGLTYHFRKHSRR